MKRLIDLRRFRPLAGLILMSVAVFFLASTSAEAQWVQVNDELKVMNETFTGTTLSSGWNVGGSNYTPSLTAAANLDPAGSGWLRLTSAATQQATYAYNSESFAAENATIAVKFKYAAYGGNGADGITFFLADASKTFGVGAYGGSLGYAQKTLAGGGEANMVGMNGGYIGLGIDEFGNYSNPTEGRIGGPGSQPGNISIRGPGDGYNGYEYLGGTGQLTTPIAFDGTTRPSGVDERTFQVVITATNQLTVYMQAGDSAPMQALYSIDLSGYARPEDLVLGFTGSTGGQTNIHEIQGLMLTSQVARLWDNTSGDSTWSGSTNWDGSAGKTPAVGADILLDNHYVNSAQTINVGAGATRSIRSLQIDAPFAYTLNNGTLEFDDQGVLGPSGIFVSQGNGAANHTIGSAITLGNAIDISNSSSGILTMSGPLSNNGHAVTLAGSGNTLLSGAISGGGSLQKLGSGTATLSGNSTYSGGTTLSVGTLAVGHNNALGTGALTIKAGTLTSIASTPNTVGNNLVLQGNAAFTNINTSGTLTQSGANRTLTLSNVTHSGTVNLSNDATGRTLTVGVDAGNSTIAGVIQNGASGSAGAGSLIKTGTGTLTLGGANTYTGTTAINAGTIRLGADNRLADTSSVSIGSLGTLDLAGRSEKIGNLTAAGGATLNFGTGSGLNTFVFGNYTAPTSGVLVVSNWERNSTFEDVLATTVGGQNVNTIYFSGFGVGEIAGQRTSNIYGSGTNGAFLITPVATAYKEWDGSAPWWGTAYWSTAENWTTPNAPTSTEIALFDQLGLGRLTANLDATTSIAGIRFGAGATQSYTLTNTNARTLSLTGTVPYIQQQSGVAQNISVSNLALARSTVADITGAGNLNISSVISGTGAALIRDGKGAGRLVLSGANTFTGGLYINNGIVQANNNAALGSGAATLSDGTTLEITGGRTIANAISVIGGGVNNGGALRSVTGANTLSGTITETGATTITADSGASLTLSGNLTGDGFSTTFGGAGNITLGSTTAGAIATGTGGVIINGTGTVTFSGGTSANTYTGTTEVNSGKLVLNKTSGTSAIAGNLVIGDNLGSPGTSVVQLGQSNQIKDTSRVTINADGQFDLNGSAETIGSVAGSGQIGNASGTASTLTVGDTSTSTFDGKVTGNLGLIKAGTGKLTLKGDNTYTGGTNLQKGILAIQSNTALGTGALAIASGSNLELAGGITVSNAMTLNGPGTLANDGAIQSTAGSNTLTGNISLADNARLHADAGSALNLTTGTTSLSSYTLTIGGAGSTSISQVISGTGGLIKADASTLTLSGSNTYTGATRIDAGSLQLGASNVLSNSTAVTVGHNATFNVNGYNDTIGSLAGTGNVALGSGNLSAGANNSSSEFAGNISGSGSFTKVGSGNLSLTGANTLTGTVTLSGSDGAQTTLASTSGQAWGSVSSITVNAGNILTLGAADQINDSANLTLAGGTFSVNGFSETMQQVSMTSSSTIDYLNDGSVLRFDGQIGSVSGLGTLSGTLTITNWAGSLTGGGTEQFVVYSTSGTPLVSNINFDGWGTATAIDRSDTLGAGFWEIVPITVGTQWGINGDGMWDNDSGNWRRSSTGATVDHPDGSGAVAILGDRWNGSAFTALTADPTISLQKTNQTVGKLIFSNSANRDYTIGTGTSGRLDFNTGGYGTSSVQIIVDDNGSHTINTNGYVADPLLITNNSDASVGLDINGTLDFIKGAASASLTVNGSGTTRIDGRVTHAGTYDRTNGVDTLSLVKTGSGTLVLGNSNTFNGTTLLRAGTLQIENAAALGTSALTINDAATTNSTNTNFLIGAAGVTFASDFTVGSQGATTTIGGNFGSGNAAFSGNITLNKSVSLTASSGSTVTFSGTIAGGSGRQSLTKEGSGTVVLSNTGNSYNGGTIIRAGTLRINGDRSLGAIPTAASSDNITLDGGTLATSQSMTLNSNRGVTVGAAGGTIQVADASTLNFSSTITGPGELTLALGGTGVFNLTSDVTFGGTLNLSGGTLRLTDATFAIGTFHITGNTILDFSGSSSTLDITHLIIDDGVNVTVRNWQNGSDFLLAQTWQGATINTRGEGDETKVIFDPPGTDPGNSDDTAWLPYDGSTGEITPVPEPSTYGAILLGLCVAAVGWRRWRSQAQAQH
jgi:autotransporter-associated beta strand protein